jgi:hypothetical protein
MGCYIQTLDVRRGSRGSNESPTCQPHTDHGVVISSFRTHLSTRFAVVADDAHVRVRLPEKEMAPRVSSRERKGGLGPRAHWSSQMKVTNHPHSSPHSRRIFPNPPCSTQTLDTSRPWRRREVVAGSGPAETSMRPPGPVSMARVAATAAAPAPAARPRAFLPLRVPA